MGKSKGRKMGGPWRRVAPGRSITEERRSATTMTCVSLSCRFMFWALKTRARLPHKNTLTSDDEAGSAANTAAERLAPAQVTPSPQSLSRSHGQYTTLFPMLSLKKLFIRQVCYVAKLWARRSKTDG